MPKLAPGAPCWKLQERELHAASWQQFFFNGLLNGMIQDASDALL